ncbi:hypothetical protein H696_03588 [Fonticula alba]|uniref:RNA polymerase I-specific transcription initiation factor RRN3 n=1 Tax=Fonticula alba TaxID=691883 RepID=A0A058Z9D4_FONAL|nr:hypothetical protein H696_03588 [Fonticula alba]KCV70127.1 hypothetical protein H696_03588 [Fonticula alba]|eukprot:XP_009495733.1 hypothetical protein H696_03588 [Fonticula alba]
MSADTAAAEPIELTMARIIIKALDDLKHGSRSEFDIVVKSLVNEQEPEGLKRWIVALIQCVSSITPSAGDLVSAILSMEWVLSDHHHVSLYLELIEQLLACNASFSVACLRMIVSNFGFANGQLVREAANMRILRSAVMPESLLAPHDGSQAPSATPDGIPDTIEAAFERVHSALASACKIVPVAKLQLPEILAEFYPHKALDTAAHFWYMQNLLRIVDYLPDLLDCVLDLFLQRLVQIDVELQLDADEISQVVQYVAQLEQHRAAALQQQQQQQQSDTPEMRNSHSPNGEPMTEADLAEALVLPPDVANAHALVLKIDTLLKIAFDFLNNCHQHLDEATCLKVLQALLRPFERYVVPTNQSRFAQFLVFHFASLSPALAQHFITHMQRLLLDPSKPLVSRQAAASYISSFLARSRTVTDEHILSILALFSEWLHNYQQSFEGSPDFSTALNPLRHSLFYFICQALFYVFCFHHARIVAAPGGGVQFVRSLSWSRLINSRLNPLRICSPSVVDEFATITQRLEIAYCFVIIKQNRSHLGFSSASSTVDFSSFFTFEPYGLPQTRHFVDPYFITWQDVQQVGTGTTGSAAAEAVAHHPPGAVSAPTSPTLAGMPTLSSALAPGASEGGSIASTPSLNIPRPTANPFAAEQGISAGSFDPLSQSLGSYQDDFTDLMGSPESSSMGQDLMIRMRGGASHASTALGGVASSANTAQHRVQVGFHLPGK